MWAISTILPGKYGFSLNLSQYAQVRSILNDRIFQLPHLFILFLYSFLFSSSNFFFLYLDMLVVPSKKIVMCLRNATMKSLWCLYWLGNPESVFIKNRSGWEVIRRRGYPSTSLASTPQREDVHAMDSSELRPCHPSTPIYCLDSSSFSLHHFPSDLPLHFRFTLRLTSEATPLRTSTPDCPPVLCQLPVYTLLLDWCCVM